MTSKSFARQSTITGIGHGLSMISVLVVQIIIAREFGPEGRGIYANAFAFAGVLGLLIGTGHETSNTYFVASGKHKISQATGSSLMGLGISSAVLFFVTAFIVWLRPSFISISSNQVIILAASSVPLKWAAQYVYGLLRGKGRADLAYVFYPSASIAWLFALAVICYGLGVERLEAIFIARIFAVVASLIIGLWLLKKLAGALACTFSWEKFIESVHYGMRQIPGKIANPQLVRPDMLLFPMLCLTGESIGVYAQGVAILDQLMALSAIIGWVLMGRVSESPEKSVNMTAFLCRFSLFSTLILGLSVMAVAKPLIPAVFGKDFVASVWLMWVMLPGVVIRSVPRILRNYFRGTGEPGKVSIAVSASLGAMIITDIIFVKMYGIRGAVVGVLAACTVEFVILVYLFVRRTNVPIMQLCLVRPGDFVTLKKSALRLLSKKTKS